MIRSRHTSDPDAPLDPAILAELDQLDAALRGDPIEDDQLAAVVRAVQAQAPEMPTESRSRLTGRVAAGFPRRRRSIGKARPLRRPWVGFAGASAIAALLLVVLVGIPAVHRSDTETALDAGSTISDQAAAIPKVTKSLHGAQPRTSERYARGLSGSGLAFSTSSGSTSDSASAAPPVTTVKLSALTAVRTLSSAAPKPFSAGTTATRALTPGTAALSARSDRRVERAVDMSVLLKSGKLDEAAGQVDDIARESGGYVANSQLHVGTHGAGSASYTLRVASSQLDAALAKLGKLGTVTSQDRSATDITSSYDSAAQRLKDATAVRAALLRALAKATTPGEIASLKTRIADNRRTRAALSASLAQLGRRADLSTIDLSLRAPSHGAAAAAASGGGSSLGRALHRAGHNLGVVAGGLLVVVATLLPFALLGAIGWALVRIWRRRAQRAAREAALEG